jgi:hypothetical protein
MITRPSPAIMQEFAMLDALFEGVCALVITPHNPNKDDSYYIVLYEIENDFYCQ